MRCNYARNSWHAMRFRSCANEEKRLLGYGRSVTVCYTVTCWFWCTYVIAITDTQTWRNVKRANFLSTSMTYRIFWFWSFRAEAWSIQKQHRCKYRSANPLLQQRIASGLFLFTPYRIVPATPTPEASIPQISSTITQKGLFPRSN